MFTIFRKFPPSMVLGDGQHPPGTSPRAAGAGRIEAADQLRVTVAVQHQPVLAPETAEFLREKWYFWGGKW